MSISVSITPGSPPLLALAQQQHPGNTTCKLEYLNEGGANIIFKILPLANKPLPPEVRNKLLRVRKDKPHVHSTERQIAAFDTTFRALFPLENVIEQTLIRLDENVPVALNASLRETTRPPRRQDDILAPDPHAMLITDLTPQPNEVLIQFKPKWLAQSPRAPDGARRCRTCALRARRVVQNLATTTDEQAFCPLTLIDDRRPERYRAWRSLPGNSIDGAVLDRRVLPVLRLLRRYQMELDPLMAMRNSTATRTSTSTSISTEADSKSTETEEDLCKVMTLRDCTLYIKNSPTNLEVRLGDLDLKPAMKRTRWRQIEDELIEGGWYMNTEEKEHWKQEVICTLSPSSSCEDEIEKNRRV